MYPGQKIFFSLLGFSILLAVIFLSCKKEYSCEGCINGNKPPIAIAGPDQVITLPTDSISLDGSASNDPDGKISEWLWKKISGPASFNIVNTTTAKTIVRNLDTGVYDFELKVTDDKNLSATDTVQITVNKQGQPANRPPVANAGADRTVTLPTNTVNLDGSASTDPDNNITSYLWTKISGPSTFNISNANAVQTQVTNLVQGIYQFELKVTDAGGLFDNDTVQLIVNTLPTTLPACDNSNRPTVNAQLIPIGTLSLVRRDITVAAAENKILFAGGYLSSHDFSRVDIYDVATNTWSTAELSLARGWLGAVTAGNKIFFAGGIDGDGYSHDNVDIYDVSTNIWTVSHLGREADGLAAATVGNKVFFAGGNWGIYAVNIVDVYDLATNTWTTESLSAPRNFITAVSANNKVYFSGGDEASGSASSIIDVYDNATGTWSTTTLQFPRVYHSAVAVNNILYFACGHTSTFAYAYQTHCSVETLDANTGARTLKSLFSPTSWDVDAGRNAVVKDNKIIFLRHNGGTDANKFDIYDTQTNTWSIGVLSQPIPVGASVISVNNTIYVAGGSVNGVLSNQVWKLEF